MNVRCCCNPGKLLGSVPVPGRLEAGSRVLFLLDSDPLICELPAWLTTPAQILELTVEYANLPAFDVDASDPNVQQIAGLWYQELAVKSNDTPLETLRRIVGFVEHVKP